MQNGNAYEEGLQAFWDPIKAYWADGSQAHREALHVLVTPETTKFQYTDGVADVSRIAPDNWVHDQALLDRPGQRRDPAGPVLRLRTNLPLYPAVQAYFRERQPPTLIVWGKNDKIFPADGAHPYKRDLPEVEFHLLDTGHFALEDKADEMVPLIRDFLDAQARAWLRIEPGNGAPWDTPADTRSRDAASACAACRLRPAATGGWLTPRQAYRRGAGHRRADQVRGGQGADHGPQASRRRRRARRLGRQHRRADRTGRQGPGRCRHRRLASAGRRQHWQGSAPSRSRISINTHWHFDHANGNEWLHELGPQILAHENTRKHLSTMQRVEDWDYDFAASVRPPPADRGLRHRTRR